MASSRQSHNSSISVCKPWDIIMLYNTPIYSDQYCKILKGVTDNLLVFNRIDYIGQELNARVNQILLSNLPQYTALNQLTPTGWTHQVDRTLPIQLRVYFWPCEQAQFLGILDTRLSYPLYELWYKGRLVTEHHCLSIFDYQDVHNLLHVGIAAAHQIADNLNKHSIELRKIGLMFGRTKDRVVVQHICLDHTLLYKDNALSLEEFADQTFN